MHGTTRREKKRVGPTSKGSDLTVTIPHFLVQSDDVAFREFIADLFAAASGMQALRRALAELGANERGRILNFVGNLVPPEERQAPYFRDCSSPAHRSSACYCRGGETRVVGASEEKPGRQGQPRRRHHSNEKR